MLVNATKMKGHFLDNDKSVKKYERLVDHQPSELRYLEKKKRECQKVAKIAEIEQQDFAAGQGKLDRLFGNDLN